MVVRKQFCSKQLQRLHFICSEIVAFVFAKPEQEDPASSPTSCYQSTCATALASARQWHTLLQHAAAKDSVDQTMTYLQHRFAQHCVQ